MKDNSVSAANVHKHACPHCNLTWKHSDGGCIEGHVVCCPYCWTQREGR